MFIHSSKLFKKMSKRCTHAHSHTLTDSHTHRDRHTDFYTHRDRLSHTQRHTQTLTHTHRHTLRSLPMIHRCLSESVPRRLRGLPPAGDDDLRVDLLGDQQLCFLRHNHHSLDITHDCVQTQRRRKSSYPQQLRRQHCDRRRPVAHLVILDLRHVCREKS